jgi:hypothetical protein
LQSGTKLRFVSFQVRLVLGVKLADAGAVVVERRAGLYRPSEAFTAVRPLPCRSYATPTRGFRLRQ